MVYLTYRTRKRRELRIAVFVDKEDCNKFVSDCLKKEQVVKVREDKGI